MEKILKDKSDGEIIIGSHGTALSTILNYYDNFTYKDFERIRFKMPWLVRMEFLNNNFIGCEEIELVD